MNREEWVAPIPGRDANAPIQQLVSVLLQNPELTITLISNPWAIPKSNRDRFALAIVRIFGEHGSISSLILSLIQRDLVKEGGSTLSFMDSLINRITDAYVGLMSKSWVSLILSPLFSRPTLEQDLSFDLRDEADNVAFNRMEFMKILKSIVELVFAPTCLQKISPETRELASKIHQVLKSGNHVTSSFLNAMLLRPIIDGLKRPDECGILPKPYIPLPRVKHNLLIITKFFENLILGNNFASNRGHSYLSFLETYLQDVRENMLPKGVLWLSTPIRIPKGSPKPLILTKYQDIVYLVTTLYTNKDKLETVFAAKDMKQLWKEDPKSVLSLKSGSFIGLRSVTSAPVKKDHVFQVEEFDRPTWCLYCGEFFWGKNPKGAKCQDVKCQCTVHQRCMTQVPRNCGDGVYKEVIQANDELVPSLQSIGELFWNISRAYFLVTEGTGKGKVKIIYSPIFANSKVVIHFCLENNISFEPHRLDFLYGDLKEDAILVDKDLSLSDSSSIIRYLSDKFCLDNDWYPSALGTSLGKPLPDSQMKFQGKIEQWMSWAEVNIKEPVKTIFWEVVYPKFNLKSVHSNLQSQDAIMKACHVLTDSLTTLEFEFSRQKFLAGDFPSIADVIIAEHLKMLRLYQEFSLESFFQVAQWILQVESHLNYNWEVSRDFNQFRQFITSVSENSGIPTLEIAMVFNKHQEEIYSQLSQICPFKLNPDTGVIPERTIVQNYSGPEIPKEHFSVLQIQLSGTPDRDPMTKLNLSVINVPSVKMKILQDEWTKTLKNLGGTFVGTWECSVYFQRSHWELSDLLLNGTALSAFTGTKCDISAKCWETYTLFDASVTVVNVKIVTGVTLVQKWKMENWPEFQYSTLSYTFEPRTFSGKSGTVLRVSHTNVPAEQMKKSSKQTSIILEENSRRTRRKFKLHHYVQWTSTSRGGKRNSICDFSVRRRTIYNFRDT
eukprot:TRINITY_DN5039_c0_g1_i1.p1 TRINITY_DN5039_c0_g1~~TRINITY_DN5039_c0_g1_i1.p1  ORF type:complete len:967 (-),score=323.10 TRINITY_DN5039_c0_g1_i1:844-3690(-)